MWTSWIILLDFNSNHYLLNLPTFYILDFFPWIYIYSKLICYVLDSWRQINQHLEYSSACLAVICIHRPFYIRRKITRNANIIITYILKPKFSLPRTYSQLNCFNLKLRQSPALYANFHKPDNPSVGRFHHCCCWRCCVVVADMLYYHPIRWHIRQWFGIGLRHSW